MGVAAILVKRPKTIPAISEKKVFRYIGLLQSKWVAMDKRSQVSLTFGTYIYSEPL